MSPPPRPHLLMRCAAMTAVTEPRKDRVERRCPEAASERAGPCFSETVDVSPPSDPLPPSSLAGGGVSSPKAVSRADMAAMVADLPWVGRGGAGGTAAGAPESDAVCAGTGLGFTGGGGEGWGESAAPLTTLPGSATPDDPRTALDVYAWRRRCTLPSWSETALSWLGKDCAVGGRSSLAGVEWWDARVGGSGAGRCRDGLREDACLEAWIAFRRLAASAGCRLAPRRCSPCASPWALPPLPLSWLEAGGVVRGEYGRGAVASPCPDQCCDAHAC